MYLKLETVENAEHVETEEEERVAEYDPHRLDVGDAENGVMLGRCACGWKHRSFRYESILEQHAEHKKGKAEVALATVVCSCGSTTCSMISTFGLPRPIFHVDIEPIPSQVQRDLRAVALRGAMS